MPRPLRVEARVLLQAGRRTHTESRRAPSRWARVERDTRVRGVLLFLLALLAVVVVVTSARGASRVVSLRVEIRAQVRMVESAKTTIRWFEKHPAALYSPNPRVKA